MAISKATREAADKAKKDKADEFAAEIADRLMKMRKERTSEELAQLFNKQKVPTPGGKGKKWTRGTVGRVLDRIAAMEKARREAPLSPAAEEVRRRMHDFTETKKDFEERLDEAWRKYDNRALTAALLRDAGIRSGMRPKKPMFRRGAEWLTDEELKEAQAAHRVWEEKEAEKERSKSPEQRRAENEQRDQERNKVRARDTWWNKYEKRDYIKRPLTYEEWRIVDAELELCGRQYRPLKKGGPADVLMI